MKEGMNEGMLNDTPAQNINRLLGVRQIVKTNFEINSSYSSYKYKF